MEFEPTTSRFYRHTLWPCATTGFKYIIKNIHKWAYKSIYCIFLQEIYNFKKPHDIICDEINNKNTTKGTNYLALC